jgi:hypothetical protein
VSVVFALVDNVVVDLHRLHRDGWRIDLTVSIGFAIDFPAAANARVCGEFSRIEAYCKLACCVLRFCVEVMPHFTSRPTIERGSLTDCDGQA